ncbi:MAG: hypothetical protein KF682_21760, partial [Nitrospira sp.]|nr:hypothetical protein [Nitrospira sp.]
ASRLVVLPGGDSLAEKRLLETNGQALTDPKQMGTDFLRQSVDVLEVLQGAQQQGTVFMRPPRCSEAQSCTTNERAGVRLGASVGGASTRLPATPNV